jgi:His-Xaa-Ser system radical SAM maturase HxsC
MIPLRGQATATSLDQPLTRTVWRLADPTNSTPLLDRHAALINNAAVVPEGYPLYVLHPCTRPTAAMSNWIALPTELDYLTAGDVLAISPDGQDLRILWRHNSHQNTVLLTEQCDNYCLMCSQPPKNRDDSWLLAQATELIQILPPDTPEILFTGGEPTLYGTRFNGLLRLCAERLPNTDIHILTNGRRFADPDFAAEYAAINNPNMMVGIPIYGTEPSLHDYIVQGPGAFNETIRGILNLAQHGQPIELRVVVQKHTVPALVDIAEYIARNLTFVDQVALMGLEMIGLARPNHAEVWIDPDEYRQELRDATLLLAAQGIRTLIYNHQLCLIDRELWPYAVKSISDWKNEYDPICHDCAVVGDCGGFFNAASYMASPRIRPIYNDEAPSSTDVSAEQRITERTRLSSRAVPVQWRAKRAAMTSSVPRVPTQKASDHEQRRV